ncbi:MAG: pectinacetylesterase family protein [Gammaproteobacteria bacterium]|nr:pectinacetylesterase family protein [Gammaproteobacteria bacterium]
MRYVKRVVMPFLAALILSVSLPSQAAPQDWDQIYLDGPIETQLPDGSSRTLHPSCSGGPELVDGGGIVAANTDYYFFVQKGNPNKILIGLDGGGACWNAETCVGSPLTGQSTYTVSLDETPGRLAESGGLFDSRNSENPFHNYTKVFIPYCTGDVHWGSKDTVYQLEGFPFPWVIHHRGTDNFLAVLDWLQKNGRKYYGVDFGRARDVTVTGASAGGYGANVAFGYVAELTPRARLNLISDAAIGVMNQSFYTTAIYNPVDPGSESWGVLDNLPAWVPGLNEALLYQGAMFPSGFVPSVFAALSSYRPDAHLASVTTNLDGVQVFFYGLMKGMVPPDVPTAIEWYVSMAQMTAMTAMLPNYRFFIEAGTFHTFIGDNDAFYGVGANGISLADWIREMIKPGKRTWENQDAGPPF